MRFKGADFGTTKPLRLAYVHAGGGGGGSDDENKALRNCNAINGMIDSPSDAEWEQFLSVIAM